MELSGVKNSSFVTGGEKSQLTVLACTSAAGYALPPLVIFDRLTWNPKLAEGEVPGSYYALSKNGWINGELFHDWFMNHFLNYVPKTRPLLLLLDGHSSHYFPSTIKFAAEEGIVIFVLPPNTTHITQPLDKGCFSPLKVKWRQVCHDYRTKYPGRVVSRFDFSKLFSEAWYESMSSKNIISSFKVTGICPFDRHSLDIPGMAKEEFTMFQPKNLPEKTGLKYIPLYSPSRSNSRLHCEVKGFVSTPVPSVPPPDTISARFQRAASVPLRASSKLSNFFIPPIPPSKIPTKHEKSCGSCLTSVGGLQKIEVTYQVEK